MTGARRIIGTMTTLAARMAALADQLESTEIRDEYTDGLASAAARIREELADAGPQTVWVVHASEYEDQGIRAILATPELAEQHRIQLSKQESYTCLEVAEYDLLGHLPRLVQLHHRSVRVLADGTVQMEGSERGRATWDYELGESVRVRRWETGTDISVDDEDPEPLLRKQVEAVVAEYAAEQQWTADRLRKITGQAWVSREPVRIEQVCYDAPFGRVHYRAACDCKR